MKRKRYVWLAACLAVALPLLQGLPTCAAPVDAAMLYTTGKVMVNGIRVSKPTALFLGDRIETSARSVAAIAYQGAMVYVPAESSVVFSKDLFTADLKTVAAKNSPGLQLHAKSAALAAAGGALMADEFERRGSHCCCCCHSPSRPCHLHDACGE